jgi:hypothetical protein
MHNAVFTVCQRQRLCDLVGRQRLSLYLTPARVHLRGDAIYEWQAGVTWRLGWNPHANTERSTVGSRKPGSRSSSKQRRS